VVADDLAQCLDHGDWGAAVRAGSSTADQAVALGDVLAGNIELDWTTVGVGIVDLTGIAAEDIAIAALFSEPQRQNEGLSG
jgi:ornithine cyclodeaminase